MKIFIAGMTFVSLSMAVAQKPTFTVQEIETQKRHDAAIPFTNCTADGSEGNPDGYLTETEYYKCDQGVIAIKGTWGMTIQEGWIYRYTMGRMDDGRPERATKFYMDSFRWCPAPNNRLELCGLRPDGPISGHEGR